MTADDKPKAPRHLKASTRRWFEDVVSRWELDEHHVRLLTMAAECWERYQEARTVIATEGLTTRTRDGGAKRHPAVAIEAECRIAFARLIRELDLDLEEPADAKRPPQLRSIAGGR
jgi:P27 family predicted phage terminase small subunit